VKDHILGPPRKPNRGPSYCAEVPLGKPEKCILGSDIDPNMMTTDVFPITYEHQYNVKVFKAGYFHRLIVITMGNGKFRWDIYSDFDENKPTGCSGIGYNYEDPNHALSDAKNIINQELKNE